MAGPRELLRGLGRRLRRGRRRLRFAREGRLFVGVTIALGLAAMNTGNNLLYLVLGWMLSMIVASGILSEQTLRGLLIRRSPPARVFAGRPFPMTISVKNEKRRLSSFTLEVEDLHAGHPVDKRVVFLKILPGRTQTTPYQHTFPRRGRYLLDGFRVATRFPFSLFRKSRDLEAPGEVIVYPDIRPVALPGGGSELGRESSQTRRDRRGEFHGLRELREGDDPRDVSWRATAHHGRLMVREHDEERQRRVAVFLDNAPRGDDEAARARLERAVSLAGSLAAGYLGRGYSVRLVARGAHVAAAAGPGQLDRILRLLALLPEAAAAQPWDGAGARGVDNLLVPGGGAPPAGVTRVVEPS